METGEQRDTREMAEAGQIANRLNAAGLAAGLSLTEQWRIGINKRSTVCVEVMTGKGFTHADSIRETLTQKNIIADKNHAEIYVLYGTMRGHQVEIPVYHINRQALSPMTTEPAPE